MKWGFAFGTIIWVVLIVALLAVFSDAFAGGSYHHNDLTINNYYETNNYYNLIEDISDDVDSYLNSLGRDVQGIAALSIAHGSLNFSSSTRKLQLGLGAGKYGDEESLVLGIGKLYGDTLISGSIGRARGHTSGGVSITWTMD